jgi:hypothetical protein
MFAQPLNVKTCTIIAVPHVRTTVMNIRAFVSILAALMATTACVTERVVVVTATPAPTASPTKTPLPSVTPIPTSAPTATPKPDLLTGEPQDYLPTIADMPEGCRRIPAGSGALRLEELTGQVVTFFCPDFAISGSMGNYGALVVLLPDARAAELIFDKWASQGSFMKPDFYIDKDTGANYGPATFADVTLKLSAGKSRMIYGQAGAIGHIAVAMQVKNLMAYLTLQGMAVSHQSDEYFRREAENFAEAIIAKTRR